MKAVRILEMVACLCVAVCAGPVTAQTYPSKPVHLIVPFAVGGATDIMARLLARQMNKTLGQSIVVENKGGAGGTIAAAAVSQAPADGYTVLFVTAGHAGVNALYPSLPFDSVKDFAPVVTIAASPIVVIVRSTSKYQSIGELVADIKARPGKLNYSAGGGGATIPNLAAETFRARLGLDFTTIPYKGAAPALLAVVTGETDFSFLDVSSAAGPLKSGEVRALTLLSKQRLELFPDVPVNDESILPGFYASAWYGMLVPKNTPAAVIDRLNREFNSALRAPEIQNRFNEIGATPQGGTAVEFGHFLESETKRWSSVIRKLGLTMQ